MQALLEDPILTPFSLPPYLGKRHFRDMVLSVLLPGSPLGPHKPVQFALRYHPGLLTQSWQKHSELVHPTPIVSQENGPLFNGHADGGILSFEVPFTR